MKNWIIKVRELLEKEIDIDVYDNVCEELSIAFCGPVKLTAEAEEKFANVLDLDVMMQEDSRWYNWAVVDCDKENWRELVEDASYLFSALAGFCAQEDYDRWFIVD